MSEKLTNQLIQHMFNDLKKDIGELTKIASATNGRVKSLEIWRARIAGAIAVISLILVPVAVQYITKLAQAWK